MFSNEEFRSAYNDVIINNGFFENRSYYLQNRERYRRTLRYVVELPLPSPARVLGVGGGQIALLTSRLFEDTAVVADIKEGYAEALIRFNIGFRKCNLLHDDLEEKDHYDPLVACEVIEHIPLPGHLVISKIASWLRPGGYLLLTTPNLYRLRNAIRFFMGRPAFSHFFYPDRDQLIGHVIEYSADHLEWQVRKAGLEVVKLDLTGSVIPEPHCRPALRASSCRCPCDGSGVRAW